MFDRVSAIYKAASSSRASRTAIALARLCVALCVAGAMSAFILRGLGEFSPPTPGSQRFTDVPPSNVFYNFVDRMAVLNITLGCTPDHLLYCPDDSVTRAQMAAFLVRAFNL